MRQVEVKRLVDVAVSVAALVLASPVLLLAALGIRLTMGKPVLFRQVRIGRNDRAFEILKLRTMKDARDGEGRLLQSRDRLTTLGGIIRGCSIDELPQFWNVLKGQMSLVGPRPLLPEYLARYNSFQRRRHEVKPGITGLAQVSGRNALSWENKFELDVWYVDHWNCMLDAQILLRTAAQVALRRGIGHGRQAVMPEFRGTTARES